MTVKLLIQRTASVAVATVLSTGLMMMAAEAQSLDGQQNDTQFPIEIPGINRGISSSSSVQVVQPTIVTAPDSSTSAANSNAPATPPSTSTSTSTSTTTSTEATGKKLKDVIPSSSTPADGRAPLVGKGGKPGGPLPQAEIPPDKRVTAPVKHTSAPAPQAELPPDQRVSAPVKHTSAPAPQAELPPDQRVSAPVKHKSAAAPQAELPPDQRVTTPVKRTSAPAPQAEIPPEQRVSAPVKHPRSTVVEDQKETPADARTAHLMGKGGKLVALRGQRVSHTVPSVSADDLRCANRQDPGSIGGLRNLGRGLLEYDAEDERKFYQEQPRSQMPETHGKTASVPGNSAFLKSLARAMREEVYRKRRGISDPTVAKLLCLQGVRMALQRAAGIKPHSWTLSAKNAGPYIVRELHYTKVKPGGQYNSSNVPFGAVLIYDDPRHPKANGHIEIRGVDGYYSDFYSDHPIDRSGKRRLIGIYLPPEQ